MRASAASRAWLSRGDRGPGVSDRTRLVVTPVLGGLRLDQYLAAASDLSRRRARALITSGAVLRNRNVSRVLSRAVISGDVIDVAARVTATPIPGFREPALLHEDRWVIIADKPSGVLSQSSEGSDELSFDSILLIHLGLRDGERPFLRLVHRLDRLTSGALLFARSPAATRPLHQAWQDGVVERLYVAVVEGNPSFDRTAFDGSIARDLDHPWRFQVSHQGQTARTEVRVINRGTTGGQRWAVTSCSLTTGRTHQVRVHLAAAGHPVLGDRLYGSRSAHLVQRPLIHALSLALPHPKGTTKLEVTAPPPGDFESFLGNVEIDG